ncbi:hypothetical protein [Rubricella aquisinus]|nr:hypothetical protein [Rubricella aquisinus]
MDRLRSFSGVLCLFFSASTVAAHQSDTSPEDLLGVEPEMHISFRDIGLALETPKVTVTTESIPWDLSASRGLGRELQTVFQFDADGIAVITTEAIAADGVFGDYREKFGVTVRYSPTARNTPITVPNIATYTKNCADVFVNPDFSTPLSESGVISIHCGRLKEPNYMGEVIAIVRDIEDNTIVEHFHRIRVDAFASETEELGITQEQLIDVFTHLAFFGLDTK